MRSFFRAFPRLRSFQRAREPNIPNSNTQKSRITPVQATMTAGSITAAAAYALTVSSPTALEAVPEDAKDKRHHLGNGKGFTNPWESWRDFFAPGVMVDMIKGRISGKYSSPDTTPPTVTVIEPNFLSTREASTPGALRATWLGHACYYVEFPSGLRVLFDPVFEDRCSPFTWLGPKRYTPMPCKIEDLPIVDVVVISHSHYDHLSHPTVVALHKAHPKAHFMVGLGLEKWFHACGIKNVTEMDWWEDVDLKMSASTGEKRISDISSINTPRASTTAPTDAENSRASEIIARISCLPCQHTSARTAFDKGHTLWASWAITSGGKSVWFGGDTGYRAVPEVPAGTDDYGPEYAHLPHCPAFKQIGELRGPFDLGLIPIGAYDPRHIMSPMHANPFDSVEIFRDTRCKKAMAIHWGTWVLTTEDVLAPPRVLREALKRRGIEEVGVFDVCDIGESREF